MSTETDLQDTVHVHAGPVQEAVLILATAPALADHVLVNEANDGTDNCLIVSHRTDDVPFRMWGSGAQAMWELLLSITGPSVKVSLYDTLPRLDLSNTYAVGIALRTLCTTPI